MTFWGLGCLDILNARAYDHLFGEHRRCWAHLLRDVRELVGQNPEDRSLARWAHSLKRLYRAARAIPARSSAERSLRPLVIARKAWGGTRSKQGSIDAMRRATLMDTWRVRELNPFLEVQKLLLSPQI